MPSSPPDAFLPNNLKDWVEVMSYVLTTFFVLIGGGWGLYQYFQSTRLRAAETLLKVEEEFREVLPTYEEIDDVPSYHKIIKPVLESERESRLDGADLEKLTKLDRCLRFLYLCSMLNETLRVDRALGVEGGALQKAYYYYIGILLPEERGQRPELLVYTDRYYPRLTEWVSRHADELRKARNRPKIATSPVVPPASPAGTLVVD